GLRSLEDLVHVRRRPAVILREIRSVAEQRAGLHVLTEHGERREAMLHGELRDYRAMLQEGAVGRRDDRLRVFVHRGGERPVEIARTARRDEDGLQTMLHRRRLLDPLRGGGGIRVVWVEQRGKARCFWQDCAQQLDLFDGYVDREIRQTRDVAAGMRKALDEAVVDWIWRGNHDHRDRVR